MSGLTLSVPPGKVVLYLLNPQGKDPSKARFFLGRGFTLANWTGLSGALAFHGFQGWPGLVKIGNYGLKHVVTGVLHCPDGSTPDVRSVWKAEPGTAAWSFVTAYPNR